jgi:hypothetical protein
MSCVVWRELCHLAEHRESFLVPSQGRKRGAEAPQIFGFWLSFARTRDPLDRVVILPGMKADQTSQMQRIGMRRIKR